MASIKWAFVFICFRALGDHGQCYVMAVATIFHDHFLTLADGLSHVISISLG